jgi:uncharacterized protein (UPF0276 family)
MDMDQEFHRRVADIAPHGLGLSVDLYCPDLHELLDTLAREVLRPGYLEVFKATESALVDVSRRWPQMIFEMHGEGLWVTQPGLERSPAFDGELGAVITQAHTLQCSWVNLECAAKEIGGHAFGTYLPPVFTPETVAVTAAQAALVQQRLDRLAPSHAGMGPFLLLEVPPFTYFGCGTLDVPEFFVQLTQQAACGLVLDIGHVWTIYRYTDAWTRWSSTDFLRQFLDRFPLERVVEIHVAGLAVHEADGRKMGEGLPWWVDAHAAPIPPPLFDWLEQVLAHPQLRHLRGVALEVDNKAIPLIVEELRMAQERVGAQVEALMPSANQRADRSVGAPPRPDMRQPQALGLVPVLSTEIEEVARDASRRYAGMASGQLSMETATMPLLSAGDEGLRVYQATYLPHEILHWGGNLVEMFPETIGLLRQAGVALNGFVPFWFRVVEEPSQSYDFFVLKIHRFVAFVREAAPLAVPSAEREGQALLRGYQMACAGMDDAQVPA